jgi:hypothetical protein
VAVGRGATGRTMKKYWLAILALTYPLWARLLTNLGRMFHLPLLRLPNEFEIIGVLVPRTGTYGDLLPALALFICYWVFTLIGFQQIVVRYRRNSQHAQYDGQVMVIVVVAMVFATILTQSIADRREGEQYRAAIRAKDRRVIQENPGQIVTLTDRRIVPDAVRGYRAYQYTLTIKGKLNRKYYYTYTDMFYDASGNTIEGKQDYDPSLLESKRYGTSIYLNFDRDQQTWQYSNRSATHSTMSLTAQYPNVVPLFSWCTDDGCTFYVSISFPEAMSDQIQSHRINWDARNPPDSDTSLFSMFEPLIAPPSHSWQRVFH